MRFLYYLFIVKRRLILLMIALVTAAAAWGMKTSVEHAVVRNNEAPEDQVVSLLERSALTDWDMCAQFHPKTAEEAGALNAALAARKTATHGELDRLGELIAHCARVTVPLTGLRAEYARKKMALHSM